MLRPPWHRVRATSAGPWTGASPPPLAVERWVAGVLGVALVACVAAGAVAYRSSVEFVESTELVAHAQEVHARLGRVRASVADAEASLLSHGLSRLPAHRELHLRAAREAADEAAALPAFVIDPRQRTLVERLRGLVDERLAQWRQALEAQDGAPDLRAGPAPSAEADLALNARLHALVHEIEAGEDRLLAQRRGQAEDDRRTVLGVVTASVLAAAAAAGLMLRGVRLAVRARDRADQRLRGLNASLEQLVQERTAALADSTDRYRRTLDQMLEGCLILDADWRCTYVNPAGARQCRRPAEAMLGLTLAEIFPGAGASALSEAAHQTMDDRRSRSLEASFTLAGGHVGWFEVTLHPSDDGIAIFSLDVTERRRAEDEVLAVNRGLEERIRLRTAELEQARLASDQANRAKSAFLAAMSHEVRTPLNGVIGMTEVLAHGSLLAHQREPVATIRASALGLLRLFDDVLAFSNLESGDMVLDEAPVAIGELVENVCASLLPAAADAGVDLRLHIDPELPAELRGDAMRLRQVLFNLLGNGIEFSGGRPGRPGQVDVFVRWRPGMSLPLVLSVADDGIGIAPAAMDRLFASFTRAEAATSRRVDGTGLGLALCQRLVALMHGRIDVGSTGDLGSCFTVRLPLTSVVDTAPVALPEVAGLDCLVCGAMPQADTLERYLVHAGARVWRVPPGGGLDEAWRACSPLVVVRGPDEPDATPSVLDEVCTWPQARAVRVLRGPHAAGLADRQDAGVSLDGRVLRRAALLQAVAAAAGRAPSAPPLPDAHGQPAPIVPLSVAEARARGRLILVVEDDETNRKVLLRQLEMLGHVAEVAHDGAQALRLWREGGHALVLSDLHMPVMDGCALAESIRAEEVRRPAHQRTPIVAITAHALRGEAMRAKAAGMDDFLTKPLQLQALQDALDRWLPAEPAVAWLDLKVLRAYIGDAPALEQEFVQSFVESVRDTLAALPPSDDGEAGPIAALAHRLKAGARTMGAASIAEACAELEQACRRSDAAARQAGLAQLRGLLAGFIASRAAAS